QPLGAQRGHLAAASRCRGNRGNPGVRLPGNTGLSGARAHRARVADRNELAIKETRMNLFKETARLVKWTSKVVLAFASMRPFSTFFVTVVQALSEITSLLAFLLPLKVILLVATPGVPRYFRFFIDPADKEPWIAWLSMSAVIAYLLTVALDFIAERMSEA